MCPYSLDFPDKHARNPGERTPSDTSFPQTKKAQLSPRLHSCDIEDRFKR